MDNITGGEKASSEKKFKMLNCKQNIGLREYMND